LSEKLLRSLSENFECATALNHPLTEKRYELEGIKNNLFIEIVITGDRTLESVFYSFRSRISSLSCSYLASTGAFLLTLSCKKDRGKTTGQKRGPISKMIQDFKSFLDVAVSFKKLVNQTQKTMKAIEK
jgi:hypothetical protein